MLHRSSPLTVTWAAGVGGGGPAGRLTTGGLAAADAPPLAVATSGSAARGVDGAGVGLGAGSDVGWGGAAGARGTSTPAVTSVARPVRTAPVNGTAGLTGVERTGPVGSAAEGARPLRTAGSAAGAGLGVEELVAAGAGPGVGSAADATAVGAAPTSPPPTIDTNARTRRVKRFMS